MTYEPYQRPLDGSTLGDVAKHYATLSDQTTLLAADFTTIAFDLEGTTQVMHVEVAGARGKAKTKDVVLGPSGVQTMSDHLGIPAKFVARQDPDFQVLLLNEMRNREKNKDLLLRVGDDDGLVGVESPDAKVITPAQMVDVALKVLPKDAPVVERFDTSRVFGLDVIVPDNHTSIGGDRQVGDLTKGGVRFFRDVQHGSAPQVSTFLHRLVCTNGMTVTEETDKVSFKGNTVPEILAELEAAAQRCFARAEATIDHFYDLRSQRMETAAGQAMLRRMVKEQRLPVADRRLLELEEVLGTIADEQGDEFSAFDVVNLVTNEANHPTLVNRMPQRHRLQSGGGQVVTEHVTRCGHCQSRLV